MHGVSHGGRSHIRRVWYRRRQGRASAVRLRRVWIRLHLATTRLERCSHCATLARAVAVWLRGVAHLLVVGWVVRITASAAAALGLEAPSVRWDSLIAHIAVDGLRRLSSDVVSGLGCQSSLRN